MSNTPILVSGSHHSGSTWVGKMLSFSTEIGYIHEPFNPQFSVFRDNFDFWYTYVCKENESRFRGPLTNCLRFKFQTLNEIKGTKSLTDLARVIRDNFNFILYRYQQKRPLVKDPISLFSAGWLSDTFNMSVVILIRHPAAFVGSLVKGQESFPFDHLLSQELLMNYYLSEFRDEIKKCAEEPPDTIDQGILLWNIIHTIILKYQEENRMNWFFESHEDLSRNPVDQFRILYDKLDLEYTASIEKKIVDFSSGLQNQNSGFKRDSQANIYSWKERLSSDEILRVREQTNEIASNFYSDEDW